MTISDTSEKNQSDFWDYSAIERLEIEPDTCVNAAKFHFVEANCTIVVHKNGRWVFSIWMDNTEVFSKRSESPLWETVEKRDYAIRKELVAHKLVDKKDSNELLTALRIAISKFNNDLHETCEDNREFFTPVENPTWIMALTSMKEFLFITDIVPYTIIMATFLSNKMKGSPIWFFIVGPASVGKTVMLAFFTPGSRINKYVHPLSTLTKNTLISGLDTNIDLLQRIHTKILIVKDFTTIMSKKKDERNEILAQFREAYDGNLTAEFGSGISTKTIKSIFTFIAGVTGAIDEIGNIMGFLGERFFKVRFHDRSDEFRDGAVDVAYQNIVPDNALLQSISDIIFSLYEKFDPENLPEIPENIELIIKHCADITANLRVVIHRDRNHNLKSLPDPEVGTRLVKNYKKLAQSLAWLLEKDVVNLEVVSYLYRVTLDTPNATRIRVLKTLTFRPQKTGEIAEKTRLNFTTNKRVLEDLNMIEVCKKEKPEDKDEDEKSDYWALDKDSSIVKKISLVEMTLDTLPDAETHHHGIGINPAMYASR
jgi:hypothetical protein